MIRLRVKKTKPRLQEMTAPVSRILFVHLSIASCLIVSGRNMSGRNPLADITRQKLHP
jgi:hypothetical protein